MIELNDDDNHVRAGDASIEKKSFLGYESCDKNADGQQRETLQSEENSDMEIYPNIIRNESD